MGQKVLVKASNLNREDEVASHLNREGWVVGIREGEIKVFDCNVNEHVGIVLLVRHNRLILKQFHVQSWQLIPYDSFEWGLPRRIQVGDSVRVTSPISADYGERGRVCNVTELGVDVIGDRSNTTVHAHDNLRVVI